MQLSDVFLRLEEEGLRQLLRGISMGKLKTYKLYDRLKLRTHLGKLNTENLRNAAPKLFERLSHGDEELAMDLSQAVLISHLDMIVEVLNFLGVPHEDGFFAKDLDPRPFLTEGWAGRVFENFRGKYSEPLLLFYINHLGLELKAADQPFVPAA